MWDVHELKKGEKLGKKKSKKSLIGDTSIRTIKEEDLCVIKFYNREGKCNIAKFLIGENQRKSLLSPWTTES